MKGFNLLFLLFVSTIGLAESSKSVRVFVNVPASTPASAPASAKEHSVIYLTGNSKETCFWSPLCIRMEKVAPWTYAATLDRPGTGTLELKVTRGDWRTEAADSFGEPLQNFVIQGKEKESVVFNIVNWVDLPPLGVTGKVERHENFYSPQLKNHRNISVWLPPGYNRKSKRYPVIYMHDGQNVFDPATSTWGVDWGVDETMEKLVGEGSVPEAIVVAVDTNDDRDEEYDPTRRGGLYADFLIHTLKPFIDGRYRTLTGRESTFAMGSSMGALISISLIWSHSEVFSKVAGLSIPANFGKNMIIDYVKSTPKPKLPIEIYMDHGTEDEDRFYGSPAEVFYQQLLVLGVRKTDLTYSVFEYAGHREADWARRVAIPLQFLLN